MKSPNHGNLLQLTTKLFSSELANLFTNLPKVCCSMKS